MPMNVVVALYRTLLECCCVSVPNESTRMLCVARLVHFFKKLFKLSIVLLITTSLLLLLGVNIQYAYHHFSYRTSDRPKLCVIGSA